MSGYLVISASRKKQPNENRLLFCRAEKDG